MTKRELDAARDALDAAVSTLRDTSLPHGASIVVGNAFEQMGVLIEEAEMVFNAQARMADRKMDALIREVKELRRAVVDNSKRSG